MLWIDHQDEKQRTPESGADSGISGRQHLESDLHEPGAGNATHQAVRGRRDRADGSPFECRLLAYRGPTVRVRRREGLACGWGGDGSFNRIWSKSWHFTPPAGVLWESRSSVDP